MNARRDPRPLQKKYFESAPSASRGTGVQGSLQNRDGRAILRSKSKRAALYVQVSTANQMASVVKAELEHNVIRERSWLAWSTRRRMGRKSGA
jgi:hypothetical protein